MDNLVLCDYIYHGKKLTGLGVTKPCDTHVMSNVAQRATLRDRFDNIIRIWGRLFSTTRRSRCPKNMGYTGILLKTGILMILFWADRIPHVEVNLGRSSPQTGPIWDPIAAYWKPSWAEVGAKWDPCPGAQVAWHGALLGRKFLSGTTRKRPICATAGPLTSREKQNVAKTRLNPNLGAWRGLPLSRLAKFAKIRFAQTLGVRRGLPLSSWAKSPSATGGKRPRFWVPSGGLPEASWSFWEPKPTKPS
jgi:hypothetical protein